MNDTQIASLLRSPTRLIAPSGLKAQLLADIRLPQASDAAKARSGISLSPMFWRRWFPALSLGLLLFGCLIVVAWQAAQWSSLHKENQSLRGTIPDLEELRSDSAVLKNRLAASAQAGLAVSDADELSRLREEVSQLTARAGQVATLLGENKRLQAEMAGAVAKVGLEPEPDPFAKEQEHALRVRCVSNMKQIGLGLRMYANDNKDLFPMDFLSASNELSSPIILTCPSDAARKKVNNWEQFNGSSVSYEYLSPGADESDPSAVLARCPIHNNIALCDGSVQMISTNQHVERVGGKWRIVKNQPSFE